MADPQGQSQIIDYGGTTHEFPPEFTQEDIGKALKTWDAQNASAAKPKEQPFLSPHQETGTGVMGRVGEFGRGALAGVVNPIMHPIQTLEGGYPGKTAPGGYPTVGPTGNVQRDQENIAQQEQGTQAQTEQGGQMLREHPAYTAGTIAGPMAAGYGVAKGIGAIGSAPEAIPPEMQARRLTRAINPVENERPAMMRNLQEQGGNVKALAAETGAQLKTPLDFAKTAQTAAQQAHDFFKNEVMAPIAEERIPTPQGFKGEAHGLSGGGQFGHGGDISLGELDGRISHINDQLRSNYDKKAGGMTREAMANDADLVAERNTLNDVLYKEVGKRVGWSPEEVKALRQRYGALYDIADKTNAAVNRREGSVDLTAEGRSAIPLSKTAMLAQGAASLFKLDPESIANRRFGKALGKFDISPTSLPTIKLPTASNTATPRTPAWQNIEPGQPPIQLDITNPDATTPQAVALRAAAIEEAKRAAARQHFPRFHPYPEQPEPPERPGGIRNR